MTTQAILKVALEVIKVPLIIRSKYPPNYLHSFTLWLHQPNSYSLKTRKLPRISGFIIVYVIMQRRFQKIHSFTAFE